MLGGASSMLSKRQENILKMIVLEYIKQAKPVGSKAICKSLNCSSATVRSEMAFLEEAGLLEKTHTSSGRVPSEQGYRYYVDHLMEPKEMNGEDMLKLQIAFQNQSLALSDSLEASLRLISDMTNYTTIVLGKTSHDNILKEIRAVPLDESSIIIILITDKGHVEHKQERLDHVSLEEVKKSVGLINDIIVGTPIDEISSKLEFEVKPIISRYVKEHEVIYNMFYRVFNEFAKESVNVVGKNKLLMHPEFNDIDKIKTLFNKLDEENILKLSKVSKDDKDINIYIGKENSLDSDVTVIRTNYKRDGEEGSISIIGPKRMEYDRVVTLLEFLKKEIESKGDKDE